MSSSALPSRGEATELLPYDEDADRLLTAFVTMLATSAPDRFAATVQTVLERFRAYFGVTGVRLRVRSTVVEIGELTGPVERIVRLGARESGPEQLGPALLEVAGREGRTVTPATLAIARALVSSAAVVADRIATGARLQHVAAHDDLTGLLNRAAFAERLVGWCAEHPGRVVTLLHLDVDRIAAVNATYGTDAGDEVLRAVARRLRAVLGPDVVVGRLGGDEFTALLPDLTPGADLTALGTRLQDAVQEPVTIVPGGDRDLAVVEPVPPSAAPVDPELGAEVEAAEVVRTATVAFASTRASASAAAELTWCATQAATVGKRRGGARTVVYDASMRRADEIRGEVEVRLPRALARDEFVLHYQPEVDLVSTRVLGAEALVRWNHPTLGLLLPDTFIETVENSPYALRFGRWVLERACEQWAAWTTEFGWDPAALPRVRVNVSPSQIMDAEFVSTVAAVLDRSGLPASGLGLEITERDVVRDQRAAERTLRGLADLGVVVAIDDFGTGYSSFAQLRQFTVNALKIDRRFVAGLVTSPDDRAIVAAMLSLASSLDLEVVAEGVQDTATAEALVALGCRRAQGFLYGRPLPVEQAAEVLRRGETGTR